MPESDALPGDLSGLLDSILRKHIPYFTDLFEAEHVGVQVLLLCLAIFMLSACYGLVMGAPGGIRQSLASAVKVPLLFVLSLIVCFPALFVITVLIGSKLPMLKMMAVILFAIGVTSMLLASFATISAFFWITGSEYQFLKVLHVVVFAFSGLWGMTVLWTGLAEMVEISDLYPQSGLAIMLIWIAIYAFVSAQMAWALRPFVGDPNLPFEFLRRRKSDLNFYTALLESIRLIKERRREEGRPATGGNQSGPPY